MEASPASPPQALPKDALDAYKQAHDGHKPPSTRGERLFNALDYFGIGWVANATLSVFSADFLNNTYLKKQGDGLKQALSRQLAPAKDGARASAAQLEEAEAFFQKLTQHYPEYAQHAAHEGNPVGGFFKRLGEPTQEILDKFKESGTLKEAVSEEFELMKKTKIASNKGNFWVSFGALNIGGWLVMIPMKLLEDRKEKIVRKLDDALYADHIPAEQQQAIEARHEKIHQDPHQTWSSELLSRAIGTPMIFGMYGQTAFRENALSKAGIPFKGMDYYADEAAKLAESALSRNSRLMEKTETLLAAAPERLKTMEATAEESIGRQRFKKIMNYSVVDYAYSLMMATIVFTWTRVLGPLLGMKKEGQEQEGANAPVAPAPAAVPAESAPGIALDAAAVAAAPQPPAAEVAAKAPPAARVDVPSTRVADASLDARPRHKPLLSSDLNRDTTPAHGAIASHAERIASHQDITEAAR